MRVGAHVSIAGGVDNAVDNQWSDVGGNCGQIFTHSPQVWQDPNLGDEEAEAFRSGTAANFDGPWVIHSSYLVNLCTPKADLREKSVDSMQKEVDAAAELDIDYVNVHLGAHTGAGVGQGLDNAVSALDELDVPDGVTVLVESDAGSGTKLGGDFEHLAYVLEESAQDLEICLDTAHAFAAGYDPRPRRRRGDVRGTGRDGRRREPRLRPPQRLEARLWHQQGRTRPHRRGVSSARTV